MTGFKKMITSTMATIASFGINDISQFFAIAIGIISGLMAIRHYATSIKLNKMKISYMENKRKRNEH